VFDIQGAQLRSAEQSGSLGYVIRGFEGMEQMEKQEFQELCITPAEVLRDTMRSMDASGRGIALVVSTEGVLLGTITDGDVRRAILDNLGLDSPVQLLLDRKKGTTASCPVTATIGTDAEELRQLMTTRRLRHIPIVDENGKVVDLVLLDDLVPGITLPVRALIMAGGFGKRLLPLTEDNPKPMLPVGGKPLLARTIEHLRHAGIRRISLATHYRSEKIREHFGDGESFGVELDYLYEQEPLGTGGALGLLPESRDRLLVMNGDVLTRVDFRAFLEYHESHGADATLAVREYGVKVAYGVVECDGPRVCALREKPELRFFVNAGIYVLEPSALEVIPRGEKFDMTDLIRWLMAADRVVASFPIIEYWMDIGQPADYEQALHDAALGGLEL